MKKKLRKRLTTTESSATEDEMNSLAAEELAAKETEGMEDADSLPQTQPLIQDPCIDKHCGAGRICQVDLKKNTYDGVKLKAETLTV